MSFILIILFFIVVVLIFTVKATIINSSNSKYKILQSILSTLYVLSIFAFGFGFMFDSTQYHEAIDIVDQGYIPFGGKHIISLYVYFVLFLISAYLIWAKSQKLPPLTKVIAIVFLVTGIVISSAVLLQVSKVIHPDDIYDKINEFFLPLPILSIVVAILLLYKTIKEEATNSIDRVYKNQFLNTLNTKIASTFNIHIWALFLILPILICITLILILFGQDPDSLIKVFTDTTTWRFSQQEHPPHIDHKGHYLCTVAACGDPKIVKPVRLGKRHGDIIIVNRQLMVANAFEEMVQKFSPKLHKIIRNNYDRYGYPLSRKINTPKASNITYILMKPLEWLFIICLYLFSYQPEKLIKKQYSR